MQKLAWFSWASSIGVFPGCGIGRLISLILVPLPVLALSNCKKDESRLSGFEQAGSYVLYWKLPKNSDKGELLCRGYCPPHQEPSPSSTATDRRNTCAESLDFIDLSKITSDRGIDELNRLWEKNSLLRIEDASFLDRHFPRRGDIRHADAKSTCLNGAPGGGAVQTPSTVQASGTQDDMTGKPTCQAEMEILAPVVQQKKTPGDNAAQDQLVIRKPNAYLEAISGTGESAFACARSLFEVLAGRLGMEGRVVEQETETDAYRYTSFLPQSPPGSAYRLTSDCISFGSKGKVSPHSCTLLAPGDCAVQKTRNQVKSGYFESSESAGGSGNDAPPNCTWVSTTVAPAVAGGGDAVNYFTVKDVRSGKVLASYQCGNGLVPREPVDNGVRVPTVGGNNNHDDPPAYRKTDANADSAACPQPSKTWVPLQIGPFEVPFIRGTIE